MPVVARLLKKKKPGDQPAAVHERSRPHRDHHDAEKDDAERHQGPEIAAKALKIFFKQKTAYEITYGDWSSDVCSSDLCRDACAGGGSPVRTRGAARRRR